MHETIHLGIIVIFGIIMLPVYIMIVAWFVGKPREYRSVALTFGYVFVFIGIVVGGLLAIDLVISLFVPY